MNKVVIFSDSTCDLSQELIEKNDIKIVPLYVCFGNEIYKDGAEINPAQLYKLVKIKKELPKTACPSPEDFSAAFKPYIEAGYDIFYTGIGGGFSGSLQSAKVAADSFPQGRIELVDSCNLSSGTGLLVLKACKFRDEGMEVHAIAQNIAAIVPNVRAQFVIDTLEYLHKGGRCSGMSRLVGTLFNIKPNIKVVDGKMIVARKARGMKMGLKMQIEDVQADLYNIDPDFIMVTHSLANKSAEIIIPELKSMGFTDKQINETPAGCVVSTHCGEGTIGILYIVK